MSGYLAVVLHAHLPYVRHSGNAEALEERWLFEAITHCYIPLLGALKRMTEEDVDFRITVSLSPSLLSMFMDPLLVERYLLYLERTIELGRMECERNSGTPQTLALAEMYLRHVQKSRSFFLHYEGNLVRPFKELMDARRLELITTCATHGFLPLIKQNEARRAQIRVGLECFEHFFGFRPEGIWLPECGYDQGVDNLLREFGVRYFFVDTHGILGARPKPAYGVFAPLQCHSGVAAFGRDPESSRQVWERRAGYPGHPDYREFYRDIGYDLDMDYLGPFLPDGIRVDTGFKYYRITGDSEEKQLYNPGAASARAAEHAAHFLAARRRQFEWAGTFMEGRLPLAVAPYDAELFGHWWYEGPQWLEHLCRLSAKESSISMITPGDYLDLYPQNQKAGLPMSTWGEGGFSYVWINPDNDWIYRHQHRAEAKMTELADLYSGAGGVLKRALNLAGRQLLLAQSSDWAFILKEKTTVQYALARVKKHLGCFNLLVGQIESGQFDEKFLEEMETDDCIFPWLDYSIFGSKNIYPSVFAANIMRVLILSWEYPPRTVGGLARHVYELSGALTALGVEVHVLTCPAVNAPLYEIDQGVHVHRVNPEDLTSGEFLEWLGQLNDGMVRIAGEIGVNNKHFDLVHAHDWLVRDAAERIVVNSGLPLVVTIHATEYGRNRGLFSDLQRSIHSIENDLVNRADLVICCSHYMAREVNELFEVPKNMIRVISNGVNPESLSVYQDETGPSKRAENYKIVFLGRLVPEKGVQVLLESISMVMDQIPGVFLVVAGRGPYEALLKQKARELGVEDRVSFAGFVDDDGRNKLLAGASLAVFPSLYEPFGIVALEAMAAGVPVIISDTGGMAEIIDHGVDGYKAPPGRADLLARYICELLQNRPLARDFCRRAMRKVLIKFDWKQIAYETGKVYLEIVTGPVLKNKTAQRPKK